MIAIVDWGIGGLGFFARLRDRHPDLPVVYVSDAGETPYGRLAPAALAARVQAVAALVRRRGARHLVVACNAASTILPGLGVGGVVGPVATPEGPVEITGMIPHAIRMVARSGARTLGVVGGGRTIRSRVYSRALASPERRVLQRVAQPLSALIEAGELRSDALDRELRRILGPLRAVDTLLLACTHYPAIRDRFAEQLPQARILDPAAEVMRWVERHWLGTGDSDSDTGDSDTGDSDSRTGDSDKWCPDGLVTGRGAARAPEMFLTTGDAGAMRAAARRAFGVRLDTVETIPRYLGLGLA